MLTTFRVYLGALVLLLGRDRFQWYLPFDPVMDLFSAMLPFFDPYLLLAGSLTLLYSVDVDYVIYFQMDAHSTGFFHDYICKNGENFWQLNSSLFYFGSNFASKVVHTFISCKRIWTGEIEEARLRFKHQHFRYMREASNRLRAKGELLTFLLSWNIVFNCIQFCKCSF